MRTRMMLLWVAMLMLVPVAYGQEDEPTELTSKERRQLEWTASTTRLRMKARHYEGKLSEALEAATELLAIRNRLHAGKDHPDLSSNINNIGELHRLMGQADRAIPFFKQALDMDYRLYKDQDHRDLALSLNNMAMGLTGVGQIEKALPYFRQSIAMFERLLQDQDHPNLAMAHNNIGRVLWELGQSNEAVTHC